MTTLPFIIDRYLQAVNQQNTAIVAPCFSESAIVHDEGEVYRGIPAVTGWIEATTAKYGVSLETTNLREQDGQIIVTNQVAGTFEGSPLVLQYHFTLSSDKIAALTITG